jgi:hypothetical protein
MILVHGMALDINGGSVFTTLMATVFDNVVVQMEPEEDLTVAEATMVVEGRGGGRGGYQGGRGGNNGNESHYQHHNNGHGPPSDANYQMHNLAQRALPEGWNAKSHHFERIGDDGRSRQERGGNGYGSRDQYQGGRW